jgi:hypothetical protein
VNLGVPSYPALIEAIAKRLDFDPEVFDLAGDYPTLAEYCGLEEGSLDALIDWLDGALHDARIDIAASRIHRAMVALRFPIIYTTNYDRWIERAFDAAGAPYTKIVTVADMVRVRPGDTQIVKFHGDFDDPRTIVLSESSQFERLSFEAPLDIKLRADALSRTLLFVGYSVSDVNIRYLLYRLHRQWQESDQERVRPPSYIFLSRPNIVQEALLRSRGIEPILSEADDPKIGLEAFLDWLVDATWG